MLPLKEKDKPIIQKLLAAGCCARCILRFCCVNLPSAYRQPLQVTLTEIQDFILGAEDEKVQDPATAVSTEENNSQNAAEDPPSKRVKLDPADPSDGSAAAAVIRSNPGESQVCVACLGILQELCGTQQAVKIAETVKAQNYEFDSLVLSISLPAQLCVREHSCWLHVKKEVREKGLALDKDDVIQVKEAFKWIMQSLVAKELGGGVAVVSKSGFEVGVEFTHPETDSDCHFLAKVCPDCFKPTKNKQSVFTRMAVVKALEKISDDKFLKQYPCPPARPASSCVPQDVQCLHVSVFIAGRYNKFCRSLPQTPWLIDGERRMESSVEELIAAPVLTAFRADGFNFSSSGREDVDVRTLGNGRPFAMELQNPHKSRLSKLQMKELQETINKSSDKIRVRDLQIVTREAMGRMKEGEEEKTKSYTALVWTLKPIQKEDISFIDDIKDLTLDQKTPLRVLHRRALAVRQRVIHTMNARYVDAHHFYLALKTQAGTYIKEFVHGDFGRTKPNLCELLKTDTDILELDVESVDVDWPPAIPE
ncbi:putative tRNA pseudouridine synthase Pus10 [Oryzias melastigma]|uniref:tRNA pseudouridine synthase Pus10 n=1 Tax=Oryzias melastigma TaxID=30732 RepID=A0A3B3BLK7_ORYME|nr:putative tRNA pseudouridine synthase Pus10 [Oryzias melastigma]XP_024145047.1 putative tRNA pseudouridine synthase Pus10 [Oryzias melastigma]XP_024145049.1 putative tRNA pseudouridine synthase Pus10 [Oryzias melastigma]